MRRDSRHYLEDIAGACEEAIAFAHGMSLEAFVVDKRTCYAIEWLLFVIGEAAGGLPEETRTRHPEVEWRPIIGLRNVLAHGYWGLDVETLWDTVQTDIPELLHQVRQILASQTEAF